jgi:hypothetical protein
MDFLKSLRISEVTAEVRFWVQFPFWRRKSLKGYAPS